MIQQVRPAQFADWLQAQPEGARPLLLDVREAWEVQQAGVRPEAAFELLAIPMHDIPGRLADIDPDRAVACLCHHGARSQQVAMYLERNGYDKVANIAGGVDAWSAERDPAVPRY